jgi:hypothetical protein
LVSATTAETHIGKENNAPREALREGIPYFKIKLTVPQLDYTFQKWKHSFQAYIGKK